MKNSLWPEPTTKKPTTEQLEDWLSDAGCEATDGCWVEHDGICQHGYPSWYIQFGII